MKVGEARLSCGTQAEFGKLKKDVDGEFCGAHQARPQRRMWEICVLNWVVEVAQKGPVDGCR